MTFDAINRWHQGMVKFPDDEKDLDVVRRSKATANRTITVLKAALNYAFNRGKAASDIAWRRVKPRKSVNESRALCLTEQEGHENEGETHSDIAAAYHFEGDQSGKLTQRTVALSEAFPSTEKLNV